MALHVTADYKQQYQVSRLAPAGHHYQLLKTQMKATRHFLTAAMSLRHSLQNIPTKYAQFMGTVTTFQHSSDSVPGNTQISSPATYVGAFK